MTQRVMLWNPWQADFTFHTGKPIDVPEGWRVVGLYEGSLILLSIEDGEAGVIVDRPKT